MAKLKNGKVAGKNEITGEMIKGGGDRVVDWIWKLCNMAFESGVVPEYLRSIVIVHRGISFLSVVGKLYAAILVDKSSQCDWGFD